MKRWLEEKIQDLKDKKIRIEELDHECFVEEYHDYQQGEVYIQLNVKFILELLNNDICSFKEIVDRVKDVTNVPGGFDHELEEDEWLFRELLKNDNKNNKLTNDDLKYLLDKINTLRELDRLWHNTFLIKHILKELVLDTETVNRFNKLIENDDWCKKENVHTIFDKIEYPLIHRWDHTTKEFVVLDLNDESIDQELVKLTELNRFIHSLNSNQTLELIEILRNNEKSKNILMSLIENNLQDQYTFESLKNILSKDDNKRKSKINL